MCTAFKETPSQRFDSILNKQAFTLLKGCPDWQCLKQLGLLVTSESLMHMFSSQPSSGGDSGRKTQSAPQAKALTKAKYLHGKDDGSMPWAGNFLQGNWGHLGSLTNSGMYNMEYGSDGAGFFVNSHRSFHTTGGDQRDDKKGLFHPRCACRYIQVHTHSVCPSPPGQRSSGGWKRDKGHIHSPLLETAWKANRKVFLQPVRQNAWFVIIVGT